MTSIFDEDRWTEARRLMDLFQEHLEAHDVTLRKLKVSFRAALASFAVCCLGEVMIVLGLYRTDLFGPWIPIGAAICIVSVIGSVVSAVYSRRIAADYPVPCQICDSMENAIRGEFSHIQEGL